MFMKKSSKILISFLTLVVVIRNEDNKSNLMQEIRYLGSVLTEQVDATPKTEGLS